MLPIIVADMSRSDLSGSLRILDAVLPVKELLSAYPLVRGEGSSELESELVDRWQTDGMQTLHNIHSTWSPSGQGVDIV